MAGRAAWARKGCLVCAALAMLRGEPAAAGGDAERGRVIFGECGACHSLEPGRHGTGPSLAGILGRRAATVEGFGGYSPALAGSGLMWSEAALEAWLENPAAVVPGNGMEFAGLSEARDRADVIAYLKGQAGSAPARP